MTKGSLEELEHRLRTILPEEYQDTYDEVEPVSMGSASLKYGRDGKVAWNEIWGSFCDLAMAGGPPHKGVLLEPGSPAEIEADPKRHREVVQEIIRGIALTTDLPSAPSPVPGWVRVDCTYRGTAEWLTRAIVMENVSARCEDTMMDLPAGPAYRIEKEIKNVITAISKTGHYFFDHMSFDEQETIENLFLEMEKDHPLIQPALTANPSLLAKVSEAVTQRTGLQQSHHKYDTWIGFTCPNVHSAIWMMRALVVSNVLARREETTLFVPVNPSTDPEGTIVVQTLAQVHAFAVARRIL